MRPDRAGARDEAHVFSTHDLKIVDEAEVIYRFEDIRALGYERLRNLAALVQAAYFSAVWPGESMKLRILSLREARAARRFFGAPDFRYYAVTDGISVVLSRFGRWMHGMWSVKSQANPAQGALFTFL
jgi:hypothetical protein